MMTVPEPVIAIVPLPPTVSEDEDGLRNDQPVPSTTRADEAEEVTLAPMFIISVPPIPLSVRMEDDEVRDSPVSASVTAEPAPLS